jgi:hypothetical protein
VHRSAAPRLDSRLKDQQNLPYRDSPKTPEEARNQLAVILSDLAPESGLRPDLRMRSRSITTARVRSLGSGRIDHNEGWRLPHVGFGSLTDIEIVSQRHLVYARGADMASSQIDVR